jgi:hypothetical protein
LIAVFFFVFFLIGTLTNLLIEIFRIFAADFSVSGFRYENRERETGENPVQYPLL